MKIFAPGKLILSGEHAVVHNRSALAMAVNRYVIATATPQILPFVSFKLSDFAYERRFDLIGLRNLKDRIKRKYERFISGEFKIRDVLQKPVELAQFALTLFIEVLNIKLSQGIEIHLESQLPMGCGMGSSAATILSVVHAIAHHLQMELSPELFLRLGLEAENMQHGYSSGLDLQTSLQGGCVYMKDGEVFSRHVPNLNFYLINTGVPESTTGECVAQVDAHFKSSLIWNEFAAVTESLDEALQADQQTTIKKLLQENHHLLVKIGVVPEQIKTFITEVEQSGGIGKICGAGAVRGSRAGVMLVISDDEFYLKKLCERYHYSIIPIAGEMRGVHVG
jgi:mevalonate kinase